MDLCLVLKGARLVDPANGRMGAFDVGISGGQVAEVAPEIDPGRAARALDVSGTWMLPGVIDLHVHTSRRHGGHNAHRMLARAGVCTALDMGGPWDEFIEFATTEGAGLNFACLQQVRPGLTVETEDPGRAELEALLERSLDEGAVGFKLLGGHYPLDPAASRRVMEVANAARVYVAFHAGTTATPGNLEGVLEVGELAHGLRVHLPHVNSYCTGFARPRPVDEILEALAMLERCDNIISESYLATINGTSARCIDGVPESKATQNCLSRVGYPPTEAGLEAAIRDGYGRINLAVAGENINITGPDAVRSWRARGTVTSVNFPANPPASRFLAATARNRHGRFIVDALSSDGGGHPRNVTLHHAMSLVASEMMTIEDVVLKTSTNPAKMLGCQDKGHLGVGADADVTGVDPASGSPVFSIVGGRLALWRGALVGSGTTVLTGQRGEAALHRAGVPHRVIDVSAGWLYAGRD
jgi:predicted amidohydrolase